MLLGDGQPVDQVVIFQHTSALQTIQKGLQRIVDVTFSFRFESQLNVDSAWLHDGLVLLGLLLVSECLSHLLLVSASGLRDENPSLESAVEGIATECCGAHESEFLLSISLVEIMK